MWIRPLLMSIGYLMVGSINFYCYYLVGDVVGSTGLLRLVIQVVPLWVACDMFYMYYVVPKYFQSSLMTQVLLRCVVHTILRSVCVHVFMHACLRLQPVKPGSQGASVGSGGLRLRSENLYFNLQQNY